MNSKIFGIWVVATLFPTGYLAEHYLLLVWFYSFWRVHKEGLHFTYIPTSHSVEDFVVSNGDHITKADGCVTLPLAIAIWLVFIAGGYFLILRRFRLRNAATNP